MANRFNAKPIVNYGVEPLPTGYSTGPTSNLVIPSVGLEDVDTAMFRLFDKDIPLAVGGNEGGDLSKVPVIFAGGEKWATLKRNRVMRDKNGSLILPLIAMGRSGFTQDSNMDITGRGINQKTGEIVIRRKLDKSDRGYQNLINRIFLEHQGGSAMDQLRADPGQLTTLRDIGELSDDRTVNSGGLLLDDKMNNVYETIVIPSPQFCTLTYDIIIWTQYTHHMNQVMETLISSFLPQTNGWRLDTPKGYWFIATTDDLYNAENNFEDMSQGERLIKYKFTIKVAAYILASSAPGVPVPVKRYVSSPDIKFETKLPVPELTENASYEDDPFLGADDPTLPLADGKVRNRDQRRNGKNRLYMLGDNVDPHDPALNNVPRSRPVTKYKKITAKDSKGHTVTRYVRVVSTNANTGETVYAPSGDLGGLSIIVVDE